MAPALCLAGSKANQAHAGDVVAYLSTLKKK